MYIVQPTRHSWKCLLSPPILYLKRERFFLYLFASFKTNLFVRLQSSQPPTDIQMGLIFVSLVWGCTGGTFAQLRSHQYDVDKSGWLSLWNLILPVFLYQEGSKGGILIPVSHSDFSHLIITPHKSPHVHKLENFKSLSLCVRFQKKSWGFHQMNKKFTGCLHFRRKITPHAGSLIHKSCWSSFVKFILRINFGLITFRL